MKGRPSIVLLLLARLVVTISSDHSSPLRSRIDGDHDNKISGRARPTQVILEHRFSSAALTNTRDTTSRIPASYKQEFHSTDAIPSLVYGPSQAGPAHNKFHVSIPEEQTAEDSDDQTAEDSDDQTAEDNDDQSETLDYDAMNDFGENSKKSKPARKKQAARADNSLLQEAVRLLLGFQDSPRLDQSRRLALPSKGRLPQYVKDLYDRFQSGEINAVKGNTVRSLPTKIGQVEGVTMFLFNLSSLKPSEELLGAEIHMFRRRPGVSGRRPGVSGRRPGVSGLELVLQKVASRQVSQLEKIAAKDSTYGWHWYDVTFAVKRLLGAQYPPPHLLGLSFRQQLMGGTPDVVPVRQFARRHSMPFLVLYSNETEGVRLTQLDLLVQRLLAITNGTLEVTRTPVNVAGKAELGNRDLENSPNVTSLGHDVTRSHLHGTSHWTDVRQKRSTLTNEIPEDSAPAYEQKQQIHKTHPGNLRARRKSRRQKKQSKVLPLYGHSRGAPHRKNRRRHKDHSRKLASATAPAHDRRGDVCGRKMLVLDFADIGWGDWIISPKSFEAHYCAGSCLFPLTTRLRPSNHATIQSIIHAIGLYNQVPAPCCVPDVMTSATLLYFDQDRNVVLKNYPGMTVESCACR